jgi:hypothetical protein
MCKCEFSHYECQEWNEDSKYFQSERQNTMKEGLEVNRDNINMKTEKA